MPFSIVPGEGAGGSARHIGLDWATRHEADAVFPGEKGSLRSALALIFVSCSAFWGMVVFAISSLR